MYILCRAMEREMKERPLASGATPETIDAWPSNVRRMRFVSPGYATMAIGIGHAVWGVFAYRSALKKIVRAGYIDSVGDGLFRVDHSQDERAAAFWFMFAAPITALLGYLAEAAIQSENPRAVATAGVGITAIAAAGGAAIPRSGFPVAVPLGPWMIHRARQLRRDQLVDRADSAEAGADGQA
jgi:uncharacterized protein DUF6463